MRGEQVVREVEEDAASGAAADPYRASLSCPKVAWTFVAAINSSRGSCRIVPMEYDAS
jgi:hypothetical protein